MLPLKEGVGTRYAGSWDEKFAITMDPVTTNESERGTSTCSCTRRSRPLILKIPIWSHIGIYRQIARVVHRDLQSSMLESIRYCRIVHFIEKIYLTPDS
jgi:hypothetical protein